MICNLCPNLCAVDRLTSLGACKSPNEMRICRIAPHFYEEPPISGSRGSGTVFFSGCTMKCTFCQNKAISRNPVGKPFTPRELAEKIRKLEDSGVHNINFVTPTHYADKIKQTLDIYRPEIPIVYNTSGYELTDAIYGLKGYVDIFLPDFKYCEGAVAKRYGAPCDYPEKAAAALDAMRETVKDSYDDNGIMQSGLIVRHLIIPGEIENSLGVIRLMAKRFNTTALSVMSQFTPVSGAMPDRFLRPVEYKIVLRECERQNLTDVYIQDRDSADESYIPKWDYFI